MSRNSEISRAGLGSRVVALAGDGLIPPRISETVSRESGQDISTSMVRRHLDKQSLNASMPIGEHRALEMLAAAISGTPTSIRDAADANIIYFGRYKVETSNTFDRYYALARDVSWQVERGFTNLSLKITNGARIVGDEKDADKIKELTKALNFSSLIQDVVRSTCEMGTCVTILKSVDGEYITPQISPMSYITLLTDHETPGTVETTLVHGSVTQIVHDEGASGQITYNIDDVGLFRIWSGSNKFVDLQGRPTWSIYGRSMTIGVETPLKSLMNASYYYDEFVKRYGLGRLHFNLTLLADMIKTKTITAEAAQTTQDADVAAGQKLSANEDIYSTGREVSMIESKQGFDIVPYLEWRSKQVDRALLQSDVGAGDVGSSWTSAGTAVAAQDYDTYKSLRETLFELFMSEIVVPYLPEFGLDPKTVAITATPFLRVDVPYQVLVDMQDRGIITEPELRDRAGFSPTKPGE